MNVTNSFFATPIVSGHQVHQISWGVPLFTLKGRAGHSCCGAKLRKTQNTQTCMKENENILGVRERNPQTRPVSATAREKLWRIYPKVLLFQTFAFLCRNTRCIQTSCSDMKTDVLLL